MLHLSPLSALSLLAASAGLAQAQVRTVQLIAQEGQSVASAGLPGTNQNISVINDAVSTDINGAVGFKGELEDGTDFIWNGSNVIFTTPMGLPNVLGTFEASSIGVGPNGKFAMSPSIDGNDGIWTHAGRLIAAGDPAPGIAGKFIGNASRPQMSGDGTVSWVSTLRNSSAGPNTNERALFVSIDGTLANAAPRFFTNQVFAGVALGVVPTQGLFFDHQISDNGNSIHRMRISPDGNPATNNIEAVVIFTGGSAGVPIRSGTSLLVADHAGGGVFAIPSPAFNGAAAFPCISINDSAVTLVGIFGGGGQYAIAKDNVVVAKTGEPLAGIPLFALAATDRLQALGTTPFGASVAIWRYYNLDTSLSTTAIFASQVGDFTDTTVRLSEGDQLDWTGDGTADGVLVSIPNSLNVRNLDVANDNNLALFVRVSNVGGGNERDMVIKVPLGFTNIGSNCDTIDFNADGLFPDDTDLVDFLTVLAGGPCSNDPNCNDIDFNNDDLFPDDSDLVAFLRVLAGGECTE